MEDHALFADALELTLSIEGYDVRRAFPAVGGTREGFLTSLLGTRPRIVLLDLDLGHFGDGARLVGPLAAAGINVVVVTSCSERGRWGECVRLGARQVMSKSGHLNEVLSVIRRINEGLPVMRHAEREELLGIWHAQRGEKQDICKRLETLTRRERDILGRLVVGTTASEIAAESVVSLATVRTQIKSILAKLEVSSQLAAVGLAHHVGWNAAA